MRLSAETYAPDSAAWHCEDHGESQRVAVSATIAAISLHRLDAASEHHNEHKETMYHATWTVDRHIMHHSSIETCHGLCNPASLRQVFLGSGAVTVGECLTCVAELL